MSITIPAGSIAYPGPIPVYNALGMDAPKEGRKIIPLEFDWAAGAVQEVNITGRTTSPFSQIAMLDVDNSQCGVDVVFYFLDTTDTLIVPAYGSGLFPVFTNQTRFFAAAVGALAADISRVRVLNYRQPPIDNPKLVFTSIGSFTIASILSGNTMLVAAGITGTIGMVNITMSGVAGAGAAVVSMSLETAAFGAPVLVSETVSVASGSTFFYTLFSQPAMGVRFPNGIGLAVAVTGTAFASGEININLTYRTP